MITWLIKTLWYNRLSLLASTIAVSCAFTLVIVLDAVFQGESRQIVAYIENMQADVWIMQKGVGNMHMASSFLDEWKVEEIAEVAGVARATPILYSSTIVKSGGKNWFSYVLGLKEDFARAGPWSMHSGRKIPQEGEIVLPHVMAQMADLALGDTAYIADKPLSVAGFSYGTFSMANPVVFVNVEDLRELIDVNTAVSFVLVDAEPGVSAKELALKLQKEVHKVSALTHKEFIKNDFQLAILMGVEIIFFMSVIGTILAGLIIAFAIYSMVTRRYRELAIVKALGYTNISLYVAILCQSLVITVIAFLITLVLCVTLIPLLSLTQPMLTLHVTLTSIVKLGAIAMVISVVASLIPARMLSRVEPAMAFKV